MTRGFGRRMEMEVEMPLSEHEQRVLEDMERALSAEDPKLVSTLMGARSAKPARVRIALSITLVLIGVGTLLAGLIIKMTFVGVIGFALALAGTYLAISHGSVRSGTKLPKQNRSKTRPSFLQRLEERWDHREDQ